MCRLETFANHGMSCINTVSMMDSLVLASEFMTFLNIPLDLLPWNRHEDFGLSTPSHEPFSKTPLKVL